MNIIKLGLIEIENKLSLLLDNWDGHGGKEINRKILRLVLDMSFVHKQIKKFTSLGFRESDIEIVPCSDGNYQFEADDDNIYLEIKIDEKYIKKEGF